MAKGHLTLNIRKKQQKEKKMPDIPRIRMLDSATYAYANLEMKDYVKYLGVMYWLIEIFHTPLVHLP